LQTFEAIEGERIPPFKHVYSIKSLSEYSFFTGEKVTPGFVGGSPHLISVNEIHFSNKITFSLHYKPK